MGCVEKKDVGDADDQAGQGQGDDGQKIGRLPQNSHPSGLFDEIGGNKGDHGSENGRIGGHADAVPESVVPAAAHVPESVMPQAEGKVVGPHFDQ